MIFRDWFIFVKSLVVRLVLDHGFLDQELLIGGIIYVPSSLFNVSWQSAFSQSVYSYI